MKSLLSRYFAFLPALPSFPFRFVHRMAFGCVMASSSLVGTGCSTAEGEPWTYLIYLHADNNLDGAAVSDIKEMLEVKGKGAQFVVQIDRSPEYGKRSLDELPFEAGVQRLVISDRELTVVDDLGELDSSDPETLEDFITWGLANYEREHMALFYWDHGGGWSGYGHDETNETGVLTLPEIIEATENALETVELEKFELLGFDACLMGNLEVALSMQHLTDYFLGSEENEPGHGWNYEAMRVPDGNGNSDAESIGIAIVDGFWQQAEDLKTSANVTLSLIDMSRLESLVEATKDAFRELAGQDLSTDKLESYSEKQQQVLVANTAKLAQVRHESTVFGGGGTHLVDLHLLWLELAKRSPALEGASERVDAALRDVVVHKVEGPYHKGTLGLSLYVPPTRANLSRRYQFIDTGGWLESLEGMYRLGDLLESTGVTFLSPELDFEEGEESGFVAGAFVLGDATASGFSPFDTLTSVRMNIGRPEADDPGKVVLIGSLIGSFDSETGLAEAEWKGNQGRMTQGALSVPLSVYELTGAPGYRAYAVPVQYAESEDAAFTTFLTWNAIVEEASGEVVGAALYRPELLNSGEPGCEAGVGPSCEYIFSAWTASEGSRVYLQDLVYDLDLQSTSRRTRSEEFDPLLPFEIEIEAVAEGTEIFASLVTLDLAGETSRIDGLTQL